MNAIANKSWGVLIAVAYALTLAAPAPARAETFNTCAGYIDSVPTTISNQGVWCLRGDLSTGITSGAAITVAANNVTIDCNDFKIGGLAAGEATTTSGILSADRLNTTVRNCALRGFYRGTNLTGGGHAVTDSRFDHNTFIGIYLLGDGGLIRNNRVLDTGGTVTPTYAVGIWAEDDASVVDNEVSGVVGRAATNGSAYGILTYSLTGSVADNRISHVQAAGTGGTYGISNNSGPSNMSIRDNDLTFFPSLTLGTGIECGGGLAKDNVVHGHSTGLDTCFDGGGNAVNP